MIDVRVLVALVLTVVAGAAFSGYSLISSSSQAPVVISGPSVTIQGAAKSCVYTWPPGWYPSEGPGGFVSPGELVTYNFTFYLGALPGNGCDSSASGISLASVTAAPALGLTVISPTALPAIFPAAKCLVPLSAGDCRRSLVLEVAAPDHSTPLNLTLDFEYPA